MLSQHISAYNYWLNKRSRRQKESSEIQNEPYNLSRPQFSRVDPPFNRMEKHWTPDVK